MVLISSTKFTPVPLRSIMGSNYLQPRDSVSDCRFAVTNTVLAKLVVTVLFNEALPGRLTSLYDKKPGVQVVDNC